MCCILNRCPFLSAVLPICSLWRIHLPTSRSPSQLSEMGSLIISFGKTFTGLFSHLWEALSRVHAVTFFSKNIMPFWGICMIFCLLGFLFVCLFKTVYLFSALLYPMRVVFIYGWKKKCSGDLRLDSQKQRRKLMDSKSMGLRSISGQGAIAFIYFSSFHFTLLPWLFPDRKIEKCRFENLTKIQQ